MSGTVTVLGAGAMGSALATPLRAAGWEVNLWGTWLDDHLLEACAAGRSHPRTQVRLAEGTRLFDSEHLAARPLGRAGAAGRRAVPQPQGGDLCASDTRARTLCGGRAGTAIGLAGVGDLEVTGLSGRNKVYGARIGRGRASDALQEMAAAEQTVEGVPAARLAKDLVDQRKPSARPSLPLLTAILGTIDDDPDLVGRTVEAVLPRTRSSPVR